MSEHRALKSLKGHDIEQAWAKAEKYRDLNQPEEADSICRDILAVRPDHQGALRTLGLSLTDRFPGAWMHLHVEALAVFRKLSSEYERVYYAGVCWERCAKAELEEGLGRGAYDAFVRAIELFERSEALAGGANPDPILRFNRCVRALSTHPLLLAAKELTPESEIDVGDGPPR